MADSAHIEELLQRCREIAAYFADGHDSMIERRDWGVLNFKAAETTLERVRQLVTLVMELPHDLTPDRFLTQASQSLGSISSVMQRIDDFDAENSTGADRDQLVQELTQLNQETLSNLGTWLSIAGMLSGRLQAWTAEAKQTRDNLEVALGDARKYVTEQRDEIDRAVEAARAASAEAGAAAFTEDYRKEAKSRRSQGRIWIGVAAFFALLALGVAASVIFGWWIEKPENGLQLALNVGGRVMAFSLLLYATVWCGQVALANLHQESVNSHRANSIMTLQAFREAVGDPNVKDAVVLEAARATFENVPPGFVSKGADQSPGPLRILETVRNATGKPGDPP